MKCNSINTYKLDKKGRPRLCDSVLAISPDWKPLASDDPVPIGMVKVQCDGDINVSVNAEDECYYGGSSAVLEISYKCVKCGAQVFPGLENTARFVENLINKVIEDIDFDAAREAFQVRQAEEVEKRKRMMEEYRKLEQERLTVRREKAAIRKAAKANKSGSNP